MVGTVQNGRNVLVTDLPLQVQAIRIKLERFKPRVLMLFCVEIAKVCNGVAVSGPKYSLRGAV